MKGNYYLESEYKDDLNRYTGDFIWKANHNHIIREFFRQLMTNKPIDGNYIKEELLKHNLCKDSKSILFYVKNNSDICKTVAMYSLCNFLINWKPYIKYIYALDREYQGIKYMIIDGSRLINISFGTDVLESKVLMEVSHLIIIANQQAIRGAHKSYVTTILDTKRNRELLGLYTWVFYTGTKMEATSEGYLIDDIDEIEIDKNIKTNFNIQKAAMKEEASLHVESGYKPTYEAGLYEDVLSQEDGGAF